MTRRAVRQKTPIIYKKTESKQNLRLACFLSLTTAFYLRQFLTHVKNRMVSPKGPFEAAKEALWACQRGSLRRPKGPYHFVTKAPSPTSPAGGGVQACDNCALRLSHDGELEGASLPRWGGTGRGIFYLFTFLPFYLLMVLPFTTYTPALSWSSDFTPLATMRPSTE